MSALSAILNMVVTKVAVGGIIFMALYWVATVLTTYVIGDFSSTYTGFFTELNSATSVISSNSQFMLLAYYFQVFKGIKLVISAYCVRFLIRRIPFFG